jgi:alpha-beta hydrolase superfamily lysophospholipase
LAADDHRREGTLRSRDGTRLTWQGWWVDSPTAVLAIVHGLGEHSGRYARLAGALAASGVASFAVDLRGMGRSEGPRGHVDRWSRWVEDLVAFNELVVEQSAGAEVVPLGHSFGGVLVATAVLSGALRPRRFVLSNPALRRAVAVPGWKLALGRATSGLLPRLALANEVDPALLSRDPEVAATYAADPLVHDRISTRLFAEWSAASERVLAQASSLRVPVLLILSEDDRLIDHRAGLRFGRSAGPVATVRLYPGRYHEPFNDLGAEEVFADLAAWLHAPVPVMPKP